MFWSVLQIIDLTGCMVTYVLSSDVLMLCASMCAEFTLSPTYEAMSWDLTPSRASRPRLVRISARWSVYQPTTINNSAADAIRKQTSVSAVC